MKVNLGCGTKPIKRYLNVDCYEGAKYADLVADFLDGDCRFPDGSISEVLAIHVIEHVPSDQVDALIGRIHRWLAPGGKLIVEMPELDKCLDMLDRHDTDGRSRFIAAKAIVGGRPERKKEWHNWINRNADQIFRHAIERIGTDLEELLPDEWLIPGAIHYTVWPESSFSDFLDMHGFDCEIRIPQFHGARIDRDVRYEAVKR